VKKSKRNSEKTCLDVKSCSKITRKCGFSFEAKRLKQNSEKKINAKQCKTKRKNSFLFCKNKRK
jgi:hypothetical protein